MPELLSPAGNFEKMVAAIRYGADAVYLAGQMFGMRSAADNFTLEELKEAVAYAHARGVRVYLTVNTMPREDQYEALKAYFSAIRDFGLDALIVADLGVLALANEMLPGCEIHISTQANTVSAHTAKAWQTLGAKRVVLSRELTLEEIKNIRQNIPKDLEIECFVHGSMCISYSGRCLLSNFLTGRDANRGACTQPCRWNYTCKTTYEIVEEKRPDTPMEVVEEGGETFVLSSRDLCTVSHIPALVEAGIDSFKIEGRMKSAYYTAVVTNAYRMALDAYEKGITAPDPSWVREVESVSHREYATGYFFADSHEDARTCHETGYLREKAYLATVLSYDGKTGMACFVQRNKVSVGDKVELLTPGKIGEPIPCEALFDEMGEPLASAPHPAMKFYMPVPHSVLEGDILRGGN